MKKILCKLMAICVTVSMLFGIIPLGAMADSTAIINEPFTTYGGGYKANATGLTGGIWINAGYRVSHISQDGRFGKAVGDKSFNAGANPLATNEQSMLMFGGLYADAPIPSFSSGDILEFNFQIAKNDLTPFALNVGGTNYPAQNLLVVNSAGNVTFAGAARGAIPGYKLGKWYDYKISFIFGETGSGASLYIDGVPYAEDVIISNGLIDKFTVFDMYTFNTSNKVIAAGAVLDTSLDNVSAIKYTDGDSPEYACIDLYSENSSVNFIKNNYGADASIMITDASMSTSDVLNAISGNFTGATLLDEDFNTYSGNVKPGYLKVTKADGRDSWISVDALSGAYFEENFNGESRQMAFTMWSKDRANIAESFEGGIGGKSADDKANILKSEGKAGRQESSIGWKWSQTEFKNIESSVTFEMQFYRSNENMAILNPYYYHVYENGTDTYSGVPLDTIEPGKWTKLAYHFDAVNDKLIVYKNGVQVRETQYNPFNIAYRTEYGIYFNGSEENPLPWVAGLDNFRYSFGPYDPSADVINLTAKDGVDVTVDGNKIVIGSQMTKDEFIDALSFGDATAKIFDSKDFASTAKADVENVVDKGQWLLLYSANGEVIEYYEIMYKLGVEHSVYFEENFEGDSPKMKFTMWSADRANIAESFEGGIGGKSIDDKANILKSEGKAGRQEKTIGWKWAQDEYKAIKSSVTFEMQFYRTDNFGIVNPYYYLVFENGADGYKLSPNEAMESGRWIKYAYHFDAENNKLVVYKNGVAIGETAYDPFDIAYRMEYGVYFAGSEENPLPWVAGLDNFRYSFGPYDPSADVISLSSVAGSDVKVNGDKITIGGQMTKADFLGSLSFGDATAKIFDSADFASTAKADSENIVDKGQWLLLYSANGEVIEYFEICRDYTFSAIEVSEDDSKITASAEVTLNVEDSAYETLTLYVAAYSGNKLVGINMQKKAPAIGESTPFTAEITKESGMNITSVKAFIWYDNIIPTGLAYPSASN